MRIDEIIISEAKLPEVLETKEQIEAWLKKRGKRIDGSWKINDDLTVDVEGDVDLSGLKFTRLPVRFKKVSGRFFIRDTPVTTLEGCPEEVGTWFDCSDTMIKNLVGGPRVINASGTQHNDNYYANNIASLSSLEGVAESCKTLIVGFCRNLKKFDYLPANVRRITAPASGIQTLKGIDKKAKHLEHIQINANPVTSGLLSLLKIPSLNFSSVIYQTSNEVSDLTKAGKIVDLTLEAGGDIIDVQSDLIDAGLEEMAKY